MTIANKKQATSEFQKLFNKPQDFTVLNKLEYIEFQDISQIENKVFDHQNTGEIMIIDAENKNYSIICFDYKMIIIYRDLNDGTDILDKLDTFTKYFLPRKDTKTHVNSNKENDRLFLKEITSFNEFLNRIRIDNSRIQRIWRIITRCLSAFLVKKGHENAHKMHFNHLSEQFKEYQFDFSNNSYVELAFLGIGSCGFVHLIYHFPTETIFIRKMLDYKQTKATITNERERENYLLFESQKERYPYIPQYYGYIESQSHKHLLIEYIEISTLDKYEIETLSLEEKYDIIFELLLTIRYIHSLGYVYRDLKLNNIIINHNKDAILIDFDRLIKFEAKEEKELTEGRNEISNGNSTENKIETVDFGESAAPEKHKTYKSDICSLGHVIRQILDDETKKDKIKSDIDFIYKMCLNGKEEERPNISSLIYIFYIRFLSNTQMKSSKGQNLVALLEKYFIKASELIDLFTLYHIYSEGLYISKDNDKANTYFNQIICKFSFLFYPNICFIEENFSQYQNEPELLIFDKIQKEDQNIFILCFDYKIIFIKGKYEEKTDEKIQQYILEKYPNFNKYYLQNDNIYNEKWAEIDYLFHTKILEFKIDNLKIQSFYDMIANCLSTFLINKVYHYLINNEDIVEKHSTHSLNQTYNISKIIHFILGSDQNDPQAQFNLGIIYEGGEYVTRDINKAIHYYSLAANQNLPEAQFNLGLIYHKGKYVTCDINKAIHYFSLAANQNLPEAQFILGHIYYEGIGTQQNFKKSIYYFTLSSIYRCKNAHFAVGYLYHEGKYINKDINTSIRYYKEGSTFNDQYAKNNLGVIFKNGDGEVKPHNGLSLSYFEEAVRLSNDILSMYNLAHMHIYDMVDKIDESIPLLYKSFKLNFLPSKKLLCIALVKKHGNDMYKIGQELTKLDGCSDDDKDSICKMILNKNYGNTEIFESEYKYMKTKLYLYNIHYEPILFIDEGMLTLVGELHPKKTKSSMTFSEDGIETSQRDLQLANACLPMDSTELGIEIRFNDQHSANPKSQIDLILDGILTSLSFVHFSKHLMSIETPGLDKRNWRIS